jgi:glycine dehydrogenase
MTMTEEISFTDTETEVAQDMTKPAHIEDFTGFAARHIGLEGKDLAYMLGKIGLGSLDELGETAVPPSIKLGAELDLAGLPEALSEEEALAQLRGYFSQNQVLKSALGLGFHGTHTPGVIQRNVLENPGWYTGYTPYQAEISQGRLELLFYYQTMIVELTGLDVANASMLDEASACAEAMAMAHSARRRPEAVKFFVAEDSHPQNIAVVKTRARALGVEIVTAPVDGFQPNADFFGALLPYPATDGLVRDYTELTGLLHAAGAQVILNADILSLVLLKSPGELGADIAVGSAQRFGVPMGFGGPHAAFLATKDAHKRRLPGRLIGQSHDAAGRPGYRLSLQTREQHIRREKATSNICTAQALLANMATLYAIYHGPQGLKEIAGRVHGLARTLAAGLVELGHNVRHNAFFDTLRVDLADGIDQETAVASALEAGFNIRAFADGSIGIALDETTTPEDVMSLWEALSVSAETLPAFEVAGGEVPVPFARQTPFLRQEVFHIYHTETELLRYLKRLENKDLTLTSGMIPLGSCTMKLNATAEMAPLSWPETANLHPFAPAPQTAGYLQLFEELESWLAEITGLPGVSLQPNAGSQGEYAGLLAIRGYQLAQGQAQRTVCLIPTSAHGTNPASAVMAGFQVRGVRCDELGNIELEHLKERVAEAGDELGALMITYPSTHGVFEEGVKAICALIHEAGAQVYMDGANLNAQVGLCSPGSVGADVCHLNLHKTFCIPHGGGGPGVGPIAVAEHLRPYLPDHPVVPRPGRAPEAPVTTAGPWGSASILTISWMYIAMMSGQGLKRATQAAILSANYIAKRLEPYYPVLYRGRGGLCAHECILDVRPFEDTAGIKAEDVAKRLMDYGFHAPTMSWPVAGTLMVEPTESESLKEVDRFCDAMIAIHGEIKAIEAGELDRENNPLKNAPHPAEDVISDKWDRPYGRERAAYPVSALRQAKYWPPVSRIDNVFGDRNLVCSCPPMEELEG